MEQNKQNLLQSQLLPLPHVKLLCEHFQRQCNEKHQHQRCRCRTVWTDLKNYRNVDVVLVCFVYNIHMSADDINAFIGITSWNKLTGCREIFLNCKLPPNNITQLIDLIYLFIFDSLTRYNKFLSDTQCFLQLRGLASPISKTDYLSTNEVEQFLDWLSLEAVLLESHFAYLMASVWRM